MTSQIIICMAIFVVTLISYMLNKIPMWVTALLSMAALYITGCIDDTGALSGFANNNTILMATMFMVAAGFRRTSLVETMCMADGGYDLKSLFKSAWSITLILPILYILYTMTVFPCF